MLVWRLNLAWTSGDPNQCLRLGDHVKRDRTLGARFRERASCGSALTVSTRTPQRRLTPKIARHNKIEVRAVGESGAGENNLAVLNRDTISLVDAAKVACYLAAHAKSLI